METGESGVIVDQVDPVDSEKVVVENREALLLRKTSEILGVDSSEIEFRNLEPYLAGENRFLYGFTLDCFVKIGGDFGKVGEPAKEQLKREYLGMQIALRAGFPIVEIKAPLIEIGTETNDVLLAVQKLSFSEGLLIATNEQIAGESPDLGKKVSCVLAAKGRTIPRDLETLVLKRGDWRSKSPDTFRKVWQEELDMVFKEEYDQERDRSIGREKLEGIIKEGEMAVEEVFEQTLYSEDEFIVHNDFDLKNIFITKEGEVVFLDWEYAGATHYENLALLTDMTNFWARCWPNPQMQAEFTKTFFKEAVEKQKDPKLTYLMLKIMIIHGSLFLAKYGMASDHHEHQMTVSLLGNLEANLKVLEDTREELGVSV